MINWNDYPNFSKSEFDCSHTGENDMKPAFMEKLQALRTLYKKPITINSGYRSIDHPLEAKKAIKGTHTKGIAADVSCDGQDAYEIVHLAMNLGFTGIGVAQKGNMRFIHLDTWGGGPRPNIWSY